MPCVEKSQGNFHSIIKWYLYCIFRSVNTIYHKICFSIQPLMFVFVLSTPLPFYQHVSFIPQVYNVKYHCLSGVQGLQAKAWLIGILVNLSTSMSILRSKGQFLWHFPEIQFAMIIKSVRMIKHKMDLIWSSAKVTQAQLEVRNCMC